VQLAGEHLRLLPERADYWVERQTLLVADIDWGKAAIMRAEGDKPIGFSRRDPRRILRSIADHVVDWSRAPKGVRVT